MAWDVFHTPQRVPIHKGIRRKPSPFAEAWQMMRGTRPTTQRPRKRRRELVVRRFQSDWRRTAFECLEERALLTAAPDVAQEIVNKLTPYQTALTTAIDTAASLPLVGKQFKDLQQLNTILQDSLTSIEQSTENLQSGHFQLAIPPSGYLAYVHV